MESGEFAPTFSTNRPSRGLRINSPATADHCAPDSPRHNCRPCQRLRRRSFAPASALLRVSATHPLAGQPVVSRSRREGELLSVRVLGEVPGDQAGPTGMRTRGRGLLPVLAAFAPPRPRRVRSALPRRASPSGAGQPDHPSRTARHRHQRGPGTTRWPAQVLPPRRCLSPRVFATVETPDRSIRTRLEICPHRGSRPIPSLVSPACETLRVPNALVSRSAEFSDRTRLNRVNPRGHDRVPGQDRLCRKISTDAVSPRSNSTSSRPASFPAATTIV